jgi:aminopeptidase N
MLRNPFILGALLVAMLRIADAAAPFSLVRDPSWSGPPPLAGWLDPAQSHAACEACRSGKERAAAGRLVREMSTRTEDPREAYDALYYALELEMYQGGSSLDGTVTMHLRSLVDDLAGVVVDAGPNLEIHEVRVDGGLRPHTHADQLLSTTLESPLSPGQSAVLEIDYTATYTGGGVLSAWRTNVQTGQQIHTLTTQSEPFDARRWWPCKDDTRDKADSLRITVRTDDFNTAVSNGVLEAVVDHGDGTRSFVWFERWPMVTYLASVCVAEYNHAETVWNWNEISLPMHDWSWSLSAADQQDVMDAGLYALTALSERFGLYPFYDEKYGHAQYTWGGAMEHQTCSSMGFYNEAVIAHEAAHQWFGDKITCDTFHHIWLNEGWATYSEALYYEYYFGQEMLHEYMTYEQYWGAGTIYIENPYTDNIFDGNLSYRKASWVVHMLRGVMGEEAFWPAVHAYLGPNERDRHRTADTEDFRGYMEAEHGGDLSWFFEQWIMGEYWPDYGYAWNQESIEEETWINLQLVQLQAPQRQVFTMPIEVRVQYIEGGEESFRIFNDRAAQSFSFQIAGPASQVELDPDQWILRQATLLSTPPPTEILVEAAELLDSAGDPLEVVPAGGDFQLRLRIGNTGAPAENLEAVLSVDLDGVILEQPQQSLGTLDFGASLELTFAGSGAGDLGGMAGFELALSWDGGAEEAVFAFPAGHPELLLVDDTAVGDPSYAGWYEGAMAGRIHFLTLRHDELPASLDAFRLVLWSSGDSRRALAGAEWNQLEAFVAQGGHLVFSGRHFAESQDPVLLSTHTGIEVLSGTHEASAVNGSGLFEDERWFLFGGGAGNQTEMDLLNGMLDCMSPIAHYHGQDEGSAGEELWCGEGGVIVFGFGLEGIAPVGTGLRLDATLDRLLEWSRGLTATPPPPPALRPAALQLAGAWPNPFNPATRIAWSSATGGRLEIRIHNIAGQLVGQHSLQAAPGSGDWVFDAAGLASGVYFARLELRAAQGAPLGADTIKLMLLK